MGAAKTVREPLPASTAAIEGLEREAYLHILSREHTTATLASAMDASVPSLARAIARLRRALFTRGMTLVSVRAGKSYHYEIRGHGDYVRRKWKGSRLRALAGAGKDCREYRGRDEDGIIYGED